MDLCGDIIQMNSILITGGSGYIGSCLMSRLLVGGYYPINYDTQQDVLLGPHAYINGDIRDKKRLADAFRIYKPSIVIHLAAVASIVPLGDGKSLYESVNVEGSRNVLFATRRFGCRAVVFASSSAVYGNLSGPILERDKTCPISEYGRSKLETENELRRQSENAPMRFVALRLFNVAGVCEDEISKGMMSKNTLMINAYKATKGMAKELVLYGCNYATRDGSAIRDYVSVSDVSAAIIKSIKHIENDGRNFTINVGSGTGVSNLELIARFERIMHKKIPVVLTNQRTQEIQESVANIRLAKSAIGWCPKNSDINEIVRSYKESI